MSSLRIGFVWGWIGVAGLLALVAVPAGGILWILSQPRQFRSHAFLSPGLREVGVLQATWTTQVGREGLLLWQGTRTVFYPIQDSRGTSDVVARDILLPDCITHARVVLSGMGTQAGQNPWLAVFGREFRPTPPSPNRAPASTMTVAMAVAAAAAPDEEAGISVGRGGKLVLAATEPSDGAAVICR